MVSFLHATITTTTTTTPSAHSSMLIPQHVATVAYTANECVMVGFLHADAVD